MTQLVLSLFPGIGLLDMAFEEEGFCLVRGPDLLWGGDIRKFHPPAEKFEGVIGGPPCQRFSPLANVNRARYGERALAENLIPEFERVVLEARPIWFLMENVERAPLAMVPGYASHMFRLNNRWCGGEQYRVRRFTFGSRGRSLRVCVPGEAFEPIDSHAAVTSTAGGRRATPIRDARGRLQGSRLLNRNVREMAVLQGLRADFLAESPFSEGGKRRAIANGVPLPMGRAVARAVKRALENDAERQTA